MFRNSGVTRETFLSNEEGGTGRGIYGSKIANYFDPPLPNPKTNDELIEIRRRQPYLDFLQNQEGNQDSDASRFFQKAANQDSGISSNIIPYLGGANN